MKEKAFEDLQKANELINTMDIKGKNYAPVNERIKAFRSVYPTGFITTDILYHDDGTILMKATAGYYINILDSETNTYIQQKVILGTGTAQEEKDSSFINKTNYVENAETSAIGRCLAMCGFGIDNSIASAEEVKNAKEQDAKKEELLKLELEEHQKLEEELDRLIVAKNIDYDLLVAKYNTNDIHLMDNRKLKNAIEHIDKFDKKVNE